MEPEKLSENLIIADLFDRWPEAIPVFIKRRMDCVGCPMARFMLLRDAIQIYELPAEEFLEELRLAIRLKEEGIER